VTDRINSFLVTLDRDLRDDDASGIKVAIEQLRGVLSVDVNVSDLTNHVAYMRARADLEARLWAALKRD
jgi:hypothetical protein